MNLSRSLIAWLISASLFLSFTACRPVDPSYPDLEPISIAYADDLAQEEIATRLFSKFLAAHSSWQVPRTDRIFAYEIIEIAILKNFPAGFQYRVHFSVRPSARQTNWAAGNGHVVGSWIDNKSLFVTVEHDGDAYQITGMGTGP